MNINFIEDYFPLKSVYMFWFLYMSTFQLPENK